MNPFSNIWKHPRTSIAGVLISVATVAGVLAQQGVTFGAAGTGTVISLTGAIATALLGLMARDPATPATPSAPAANCDGNCSSSGGTEKLSVWLLIMLLIPLPWLQGCTTKSVAQDIVNWTPSLQSAVATVDSTASLLAPADAPVFMAATVGFNAASNLLVAQARAYLVSPNAGTLAQLQNEVVAVQQQVDRALLSAAHIVDAASQQHAMAAIQAVATIISAMLALVQQVSSKAQVARMAADSQIKLAEVEPYWNSAQSTQLIAAHYNESTATARLQIAQATHFAMSAGF